MRAVVVSRDYADAARRGKLRALAGLGVAVAAAVPDRWVAPGTETALQTSWGDDAGVRVAPVPVRPAAGPGVDSAWSAKALRRLLTEFRPDLVQIEEEPWTRVAATASRLAHRLGIRVVLATREGVPPTLSLGQRLRRHFALGRARGLLPGSQLAAGLLARGRRTPPQAVLPQLGVAASPLAPRLPHPGLSIGFFGRLVPERGLDLLFRACVSLPGKWTVTVVGTGPSQEELEGLAERLGIAARVTWLGALPRAAAEEVWPRLDCVALPSRTTARWVETVGRAALEGMAHGVAVVVSSSGVLPELVDGAGRIVPEDDVPKLTEALSELLVDRALCERLGAEGRRRALEEFSETAIARKTLEFWRTLQAASA